MDLESLQIELVEKERERRESRSRADQLSKAFLARIRNRSERRGLFYSIKRFDEEIEKLRGLLEIAASRTARPRCLNCWSDKTVPMTFDGSDNLTHNFRHDCGGKLKIIHDDSGPRFNFGVTTYVLNEEGRLLGERS
ncbi:MAG: hypothetical protein R3E82_21325 [Pseudomonadales bacterium]